MSAIRLVILGATGDLTGRYLLRALAELADAGQLADDVEVVGVGRERWDHDRFLRHAAERLDRHAGDVPAPARRSLLRRLRYVAGDATDATTIGAAVAGAAGPVVAYLALPPAVFAATLDALAATDLPAGSRVVLEKPFGTDLRSAQQLNAQLARRFPEESVFRMDHFLGEQTVRNFLGLRFANRLFEPLWCADHVERVDIVWDETVALEGRAGYYDRAGALLDMVQSHLLQVLAVVAMERPGGLGERALRDAKVDVLRAVRRLAPEEVARRTVRARYTAGGRGDARVVDYADEEGVDPSHGTETFADVTLLVDVPRWAGVPFRVRTGKALDADRREVRLRLRPTPTLPFGQQHDAGPNVVTFTMDPDRVVVDLALNGTGELFDLEPARWELDLAPPRRSAYARLLLDVIDGDPALSIRGDEAEASWEIVEPILAAWRAGASPLLEYPARSSGPTPP